MKVATEQLFDHLIILINLPNFDEFKNSQDQATGSTALHIVTSLENIPMTKALVKAECNQFLKDNFHRDPATIAMNVRNNELLKLFQQSQEVQVKRSNLSKTDFLRKQFQIPDAFPIQLNYEQLEIIKSAITSESSNFYISLKKVTYLGTIQEQNRQDVDQSFIWKLSKSLPRMINDYLRNNPSAKTKDTIMHGYIKASNSKIAVYRVVMISYENSKTAPTQIGIQKFFKVMFKRIEG
ncbi:MAG: hypothetical protein HRT87_07175 [Legionellales bacterium]|nr:hypothetical protein [Legionellales bacterium]